MDRWKTNLYIIWFTQVLSMMSFNFGIPFIPFYIKELGVIDASSIKVYSAILSSVPAVTAAIMAPIWGMAADRYGKKLMLLRAMLTASFIIAGMGIVANVNQLIFFRLLQGVFTGTITASAALIAAGTPSNHLSYALGFLSSSTFIGASAGPVVGGFLAEHTGYRISFYLGGALMFIDFLIVLFMVKEEAQLGAANAAAEDTGEKKCSSIFALLSGFMLILMFLLFSLTAARCLFSPFLPLFVEANTSGNAVSTTGIINGVTGLMTAISGLTLTRFGDRYNKTRMIKLLLSFAIIIAIPLGFVTNLWVFTIIYGSVFFIVAGIEPIVLSIAAERTPVEKRGMLFGIQGLVANLAWITAPLTASLISIRFSIQSVLFMIPIVLIPAYAITLIFYKRANNRYTEENIDIKPTI